MCMHISMHYCVRPRVANQTQASHWPNLRLTDPADQKLMRDVATTKKAKQKGVRI